MTYPCDPVQVGGMINLDFDSEGRLIGVEILGATSKLRPSFISALDSDAINAATNQTDHHPTTDP